MNCGIIIRVGVSKFARCGKDFMQNVILHNKITAGIRGGERVSNLLYAIFWTLLMVGKGLDLDSSDRVFQLLIVFSFLFLGIKLVTTRWTERELFFLMLLGFAAAMSFLVSGRTTLLLTMAALAGAKGVKIKPLLGYTFFLRSLLFLSVIVLSLFGIGFVDQTDVINRFNIFAELWGYLTGQGAGGGWGSASLLVRHTLGFYNGNIAQLNLFLLIALYLYLNDKSMRWWNYLMLAFVNIALYVLTQGMTGFVLTFALLLVHILLRRPRLHSAIGLIGSMLFVLMAIFSLVTAMFYAEDNFIGTTVNALFTGRLSYAHYVTERYAIYLFGTNFNGWDWLDNGYLVLLWNHGWLLFFAYVIGNSLFTLKAMREGRNAECAIFITLAVYGIMEQFVGSVLMNFFLLFLGELLFQAQPTVYYTPSAGERQMAVCSNFIDEYRVKRWS